MRDKIKYTRLSLMLMLLMTFSASAQVLFSDNFDNYSIGPIKGFKGQWTSSSVFNEYRIVSEPGRGNVLAWGWNITPFTPTSFSKAGSMVDDDNIKNRDVGNDVFKLEFEFLCVDLYGILAEKIESTVGASPLDFYFRYVANSTQSVIDSDPVQTPIYTKPYNNKWVKVEVYFELIEITEEWKISTYIPMLKYWGTRFRSAEDLRIDIITISSGVIRPIQSYSGAIIRYDNFVFSAVPNRPAFADVNEYISSKFNLFPNPVGDVLNVVNSENLLISEIAIYNASGKLVQSESFNNQLNIEMNTSYLTSGTYIVHITSAEGMAVKKMIKR